MTIVFHERIGLDRRRISPFSWRIRYALAHKGIEPDVVETRFADVDRIRALSGQHMVPIIQDGDRVVHDSWAIACHLEDRYPDRPPLFGGPIGRGTTRALNLWCDTVLAQAMRLQIYCDFITVIDPGDRAYFRASREAALGMTLEACSASRDAQLPALTEICGPLEQTLAEQPFVSGGEAAYADYVVFSVFQWARVGSPRDVLKLMALPAVLAWRDRMVALYGGLGDRFALYPEAEETA